MSVKKLVSTLFALAVIGGLLAACAAPATQNPYDDKAPITVWIDQPRQPAIDAFLKANPADGQPDQGCGCRP